MYNTRKGESQLSYYYEHTYRWDLERIFTLWNKTFYKRREVDKILKERKILEDINIQEIKTFHEAKVLFTKLNKMKAVSVDYETTNLFPYDEYFEIIYAAFSDNKNAWVFHEDFWKDKPIMQIWFQKQIQKLMHNPNVCKVIQNSKFEELCSKFRYKIKEIVNVFCPMLATHVIDEREGCTSLDFQNLVRFGIPLYNEKIKKYLTTDKKAKEEEIETDDDEDNEVVVSFQKVNKIREAPKKDMIQYNGLDVITAFNQYLLFKKDLFEMYPQAKENYEFLLEGHWLFARMSERGVNIGQKELDEFGAFLEEEIKKLEEKIINIPEIIDFNAHLKLKSPETKKKKNDKKLKELCFGKPKKLTLKTRKMNRRFTP
jgi:DNA polymerase I-like protein with 3'-5' exonuclease and polymerase domains